MDEKPQKHKGRPYALVEDDKTINTLTGLGRIQCTTKEAAAVLNVSEPTFFAFLKRSKKAREAWDHAKQNGLASLRRNQFKMAENNATMAIWLGKQYLHQTDKVEMDASVKHDHGSKPVSETVEWVESLLRSGSDRASEEPLPN